MVDFLRENSEDVFLLTYEGYYARILFAKQRGILWNIIIHLINRLRK